MNPYSVQNNIIAYRLTGVKFSLKDWNWSTGALERWSVGICNGVLSGFYQHSNTPLLHYSNEKMGDLDCLDPIAKEQPPAAAGNQGLET